MEDSQAVDQHGKPSRDGSAVLRGGVLPFGGHKGYGLSVAVQALGLLAGAALARGQVQDYGFLFIVYAPALLVPAEQFAQQAAALMDTLKATPRQEGSAEIRIPSERAFRERQRRQVEGIVLQRQVVVALPALGAS